MDLLKYLEPMKHLPDRFSNLAFWRGCRKFKDAVVNAFEYVDSWGTHIESLLPSSEYVKSKSVTLQNDVDFYKSDLSVRNFVISSNSDRGTSDIMPILSIVGGEFRINLTTDNTSVIAGKHIDAVYVNYLTPDKILVEFILPNGIYSNAWFHGDVNGFTIQQSSVFTRTRTVNTSDIPNYENLTLDKVTVYYH